MTPTWQTEDGRIQLFLGDCRTILPEIGSVDAVITDPPYGMNFRSNHRKIKHDWIHGDESLPVELIEMSITKASRFAYVFCRWDNLAEMPKPKSVMAWVKNNWSMGDLKHEHGRQWEAICFYQKDGHQFIHRIPDVITADRTGNKLHPTQKPVVLIEKLIQCNVCDAVCDPFMGSGSTGIACIRTGRKFIGIEISPSDFEIAKERIKIELRQMLLNLQ